MPWSCSGDVGPVVLAVPIPRDDCVLSSTLLDSTYDSGEMDDPSTRAWCGADPTDPRGRSSRVELPRLLAGWFLSSPSLSLVDEAGLKGSAA